MALALNCDGVSVAQDNDRATQFLASRKQRSPLSFKRISSRKRVNAPNVTLNRAPEYSYSERSDHMRSCIQWTAAMVQH
ncbi:hypothetical protein BDR03DRAFT_940723 [Suillus americanus]|nr:hypothetical protein BDR03DRAFT_940723 [Suillus americanus]